MSSALLVVDVQNAVVEDVPTREELVATIGGLVRDARSAGRPVVWIQHSSDAIPHDSPEWQIVPALTPLPGEAIVHKQHRSAFSDTGLAALLRDRGIDRLVVTGAQSAFCVDMAGKHALAEGFDVTLVSDGHADVDLDTTDGIVPAATVQAVINRTWRTLRHPGRRVEVIPSGDVAW